MTKGKKLITFVIVLIIIGAFPLGAIVNRIFAKDFQEDNSIFSYFSEENGKTNILIFGVDALSKEKAKKTRSDSIMLFSMDSSGENPTLISIPRDTIVDIPGRRNPEKINHAHAYGDAQLLVETVENLFGIKVNQYVRVNYRAVEEMIDAIGGIEIDVPMDMKYSDPYDNPPLHINIPKGLQVLDGKNAVHFLRFRKGYSNQDLGRIEAQQNFVNSLKDKALSPKIIPKIPKLINIFHEHVDTNISQGTMLKLSSYFIKGEIKELNRLTLQGNAKKVNGVAGYYVDNEALSILKNQLSDNNEILAKITVLNGCGIKSIATENANKLEGNNIKVEKIGNYENFDISDSFIEYKKPFKKQAQKISNILGIKDIRERDEWVEDSIDIKVIIGKDLDA
ncbi:LCP family protein [Alkaliphilus pronyensis]|nr:LCP family protein [Alkaliphilus pronyensis]